MADILDEIRNALKNDKVVYGTEKVKKSLKNNSLAKVVLSKDVPDDVKFDLEKYASLVGISVEQLKFTNEELGTFCKRKHLISVLGISS